MSVQLSALERREVSARIMEAITSRFPHGHDSAALRSAWPSPKPPQSVLWMLLEKPVETIGNHPEIFLSLPDILSRPDAPISPVELYGDKLIADYEIAKAALSASSTQGQEVVASSQMAGGGGVMLPAPSELGETRPENAVPESARDEGADKRAVDTRQFIETRISETFAQAADAFVQRIAQAVVAELVERKLVVPAAGVAATTRQNKELKSSSDDKPAAEAKARRSLPLDSFSLLSEKTPELLASLKAKGILTRSDLSNALAAAFEANRVNAVQIITAFLEGDILKTRGEGGIKESAKRVAVIAGLEPAIAFARIIQTAQETKTEGAPKKTVTRKDFDVAGQESNERRGHVSAPLKSVPFLKTHLSGLLEALEKNANVVTRTDLGRALITACEISQSGAYQIVSLLVEGDIFREKSARGVVIKNSILKIAAIAKISEEEAFGEAIRHERERRLQSGADQEGQSRPVTPDRSSDDTPNAAVQMVLAEQKFAQINLKPLLDCYAAADPEIRTDMDLAALLERKGYEQHIENIAKVFSGQIEIVTGNGGGPNFSPAAVAMARVVGLQPKIAYQILLEGKGYHSGAETGQAKKPAANGHAAPAVTGDQNVLERLASLFPIFGRRLQEKEIGNLDALIAVIPPDYLGDRTLFLSRLDELAASGQQYDMSKGKLKSVAQILQSVLGASQGEALFEDKDMLRQIAQYHKERQDFSILMKKYARPLIGFPLNGKIEPTTNQFKSSLTQKMNGGAAYSAKDIARYASLYTGETLPIEGRNLTKDAAAVMNLLEIPSREVATSIPEMDCNLVYSDLVRKHFPNLAGVMCRDGLFTVSSIQAYAGDETVTPDVEMALVFALNGNDPSALRRSTVLPLLAEVFGVPEEILLSGKQQAVPARAVGLKNQTGQNPNPQMAVG